VHVEPRKRLSVFFEAFGLLRNAAGKLVGITLVVDVLGAIANAVMLAVAGKLLGLLAAGTTWGEVVPWLLIATVAAAVDMVTRSVHNDLIALASEHIQSHAISRVLAAASRVPFASFDTHVFYDRLRRAHESGSEHAWSIVNSTLSLSRSVFDMTGVIILLAFVAPSLIVIAITAYLPLWIVAKLNNRAKYSFSWRETETDRRRSYIETLLSERRPAKEIRSYGLEDRLLAQYRSLWDSRLRRLQRVIKGVAWRSAIGYLATSLVMTAALAVVVWLTIRGDLNIEQAGVGVVGVRQLSSRVTGTSRLIATLHGSAQFLGDYEAFNNEAAALAEDSPGDPAPDFIDEIELAGVSFAYSESDQPAVRDLDVTFRAGEVTAIVGANGSGKTTLLMLLAGLYEPDEGRILWDGEPTTSFSRLARARASSTLYQDFVQYHFSVSDNVTLAEADPELLQEVIDLSEAGEYISRLPDGLETQLGKDFERGTELSIGQWQRLALARALYRESPFLLLDEPASALDPAAEATLVARLKDRYEDRCVVMISHRFGSVRNADRILVLDEGRLIEQGTHQELVALGGAYNALYQAQAQPLLGKASGAG